MSILLYGCTTWTLTEHIEKNLDGNCTRMLQAILNKSWKQHPTAAVRPPTTHLKDHPDQMNKTCGTQLEVKGWTHKPSSPMDPLTWMCKWRTTSLNLYTAALYELRMEPGRSAGSNEWWSERRKSVLPAQHDDDD